MPETGWQPWKMTAIEMALVIVTAVGPRGPLSSWMAVWRTHLRS